MRNIGLVNNIISSNKKVITLLFLVSITLRVILINTYNQKKIPPDGTGYHTIAVNIVKGDGYSNSVSKPFEPYFFREPGYPVFISIIYKVYSFLGGDVNYLKGYKPHTYSYIESHEEIDFVKYSQALLDSVTYVVFFLALLLVFKREYAFLISLTLTLYFPIAIQVSYVLRESLQMFESMVLVYAFMKYIDSGKFKWLIIFSVFSAFLVLTFQAFIIIPFFLFLFLLIYYKKLLRSIKLVFAVILIMFLVVSPWLLRSYLYYPNWRVLKSFGTTLTMEYQSYIGALNKAKYYKYISEEDFHNILMTSYINITPKEKFEVSFNNRLTHKADSINNMIKEPIVSKRKANVVVENFINSWFHRFAVSELGEVSKQKSKFKVFGRELNSARYLLSLLLGFIVGISGIVGLILTYRKIYPLLLVFTMYLSVFFILGSESRRMYPIQPFIVMFALLTFVIIYLRFVYKKNVKELVGYLLNDRYKQRVGII